MELKVNPGILYCIHKLIGVSTMSKIVSDAACPSCRDTGSDKTGNHLMVFADGNKYCNRCGYFESFTNEEQKNGLKGLESYGEPPMLDSRSQLTSYEPPSGDRSFNLQTFQAFPIKALPDRGIELDTCQAYNVRASVSPTDGRTIQNVLFPLHTKDNEQPSGMKTRTPDKHFDIRGGSKGDHTFFGYHVAQEALKKLPAASRTLYITEGEIDALTLFQTLKNQSKSEKLPPVVSLRNGAGTAPVAMSYNRELLDTAAKVVLVFDNDEAGIAATELAARVLGTKAHVAKLPMKDLNDMLLAGREKEIKKCVLSADRYMPQALATVDDLLEDILKKPEYGLSYPWPSLTNLTFGIKKGLLIGLAAGVGIGKTDWFSQLAAHLIHEHKAKIGLFKLEEHPARSIKAIAGKIAHTPFHRPDIHFEETLLVDTVTSLRDHVYAYNHFGFKSWQDIKADIRTLTGYGVDYFIIDPLTALISHEKDEHKALNEMMEEMAALTQELDITIFYSSHLNPPDRSSKSHEEGGKVKESQLYGSRAMIRWSHYIFGLERNKHAIDEMGQPDTEARNTTKFVLLKDREYGRTGTFDIFYNQNTSDYLEKEEGPCSTQDF